MGHPVAEWFREEFGSTPCRAITGSDFSTLAGVGRYIEADRVAQCRVMAERVSVRVRQMIDHNVSPGVHKNP